LSCNINANLHFKQLPHRRGGANAVVAALQRSLATRDIARVHASCAGLPEPVGRQAAAAAIRED
jgi:hypothetical protein